MRLVEVSSMPYRAVRPYGNAPPGMKRLSARAGANELNSKLFKAFPYVCSFTLKLF